MIRVDVETGKRYINNIPEGKITAITTPDGTQYKIVAQNHNHQDDVWYNGRFIGDYYGVFKYIKPDMGCGFWQQVSPWYFRYGNAERKMCQLTKCGGKYK